MAQNSLPRLISSWDQVLLRISFRAGPSDPKALSSPVTSSKTSQCKAWVRCHANHLHSKQRGHRIHEPQFPLTIGGFRANDYFGDGSFYLLDVPGVCRSCAVLQPTHSQVGSTLSGTFAASLARHQTPLSSWVQTAVTLQE